MSCTYKINLNYTTPTAAEMEDLDLHNDTIIENNVSKQATSITDDLWNPRN